MIYRIFSFMLLVNTAGAMDALYTLDFDKLQDAEAALKMTANSNTTEAFLSLIPQAIRKPLEQDFLEQKYLQEAKNYAQEFKQEKKAIPLWKVHSVDEVHQAVINYFCDADNLSNPQEAGTAVENYLDTWADAVDRKMQTIKENVKAYNAYIETMGPKREWKFKGYIDNLLGIVKANTSLASLEASLEEKQDIFTLLKKSGFLKTEIETVKDFEYTPLFPVLHFMENHPTISTLVLGCGHHLHSEVSDQLNIQREAFCGVCNLTPNHHLDDFAISLLAYDIPDVVCDMNDPRLWEVLKTKEGGWKKIAEHSMYNFGILEDRTLISIYESLSDNGIFEICATPSEEAINRAKKAGLILKETDEKKHLMFFKK